MDDALASAERAVLGAMLTDAASVREALAHLDGASFAQPRHEKIFLAVSDLAARQQPTSAPAVLMELGRRGELRGNLDAPYLHTLMQEGCLPPQVGYYAHVIAGEAARRRTTTALRSALEALTVTDRDDLPQLARKLVHDFEELAAPPQGRAAPFPDRAVNGATFVLDAPENVPAVWGEGHDILWPRGEALTIFGPDGVGKTTLAIQVIAGRLGIERDVLGLPVAPGQRRVLWLCMDRPAQARRAAARYFSEHHRPVLDKLLVTWEGPPPQDVARHPEILAVMAEHYDADTVVVDSIKDAAVGLSDDEVGAGYNRARQTLLAAGVELLELHHPVKNGATGAEPTELQHMYGSRWIAAGAGSVINLHGAAGDPIVRFSHRKCPMSEVGPFTVTHDHATGRSSVFHTVDLVELVRATGPEGLTAQGAASALFDSRAPRSAETEKARRKLDALARMGVLVQLPGQRGGAAATWHLAARPDGM